MKKIPRKFSEGSLLLKMTWHKVQFQFLLQKLNKMAYINARFNYCDAPR
jgi:hypothetical protein